MGLQLTDKCWTTTIVVELPRLIPTYFTNYFEIVDEKKIGQLGPRFKLLF